MSSPRARPSNWANAELYRYKIVAVSLHKTHICVVKSLVKIAAVSLHRLRRFIKPAPDEYWLRLPNGNIFMEHHVRINSSLKLRQCHKQKYKSELKVTKI